MANIRLRRGTKAQLAALGNLPDGEPGYTTDTKELYIGNSSGGNTLIGVADAWGGSTNSTRSKTYATPSSAQNLTGGTFSKVLFANSVSDVKGEYSTANSRFTAQAAGTYLINASVTIVGLTTTARAIAEFWVNGGTTKIRVVDLTTPGSASNPDFALNPQTFLQLNAGDYVEIYVYPNINVSLSGNAQNMFYKTIRIA